MEVVTITIGELTDFTGQAAPAVANITYVTQDVARYYNDQNLIPGARVKIAAYDTKFDPARELTGWEWCKAQGAEVIITLIPGTADVLKPFAERDRIVIAAMGANPDLFDPPGWAFGFSNTTIWSANTLWRWFTENRWDYSQGIPPKIGIVGWNDPSSVDAKKGAEAYFNSHPGEFDYVGAYISPAGTSTFKSEAVKLKDCDYVACVSGFAMPYFLRDLRAVGGMAPVVDLIGSMGSYRKFYSDLVGWDVLDGCLSTANSMYWGDPLPLVELLEEILYKYRPSEADEIIAGGNGYVGAGHMAIGIMEALRKAVEDVGAENFNGQAFYDSTENYSTALSPIWEGYPEWSFSQTKHWLMDDTVIVEFQASVQDLVTISDWLPNG